jgi:hypothetical protein
MVFIRGSLYETAPVDLRQTLHKVAIAAFATMIRVPRSTPDGLQV